MLVDGPLSRVQHLCRGPHNWQEVFDGFGDVEYLFKIALCCICQVLHMPTCVVHRFLIIMQLTGWY